MKERIVFVGFSITPIVCVRVIEDTDTDDIKAEKRKYPFKLHNDVIVIVKTTKREFSFHIPAKFIWNGADIPKFFWRIIGSSTDNAFLLGSMAHDFMLEQKKYVYCDVLNACISMKEYRRLTSLIFRQIIKNSGVNTVKANVMAWCVDVFQICNKGMWKCQLV